MKFDMTRHMPLPFGSSLLYVPYGLSLSLHGNCVAVCELLLAKQLPAFFFIYTELVIFGTKLKTREKNTTQTKFHIFVFIIKKNMLHLFMWFMCYLMRAYV